MQKHSQELSAKMRLVTDTIENMAAVNDERKKQGLTPEYSDEDFTQQLLKLDDLITNREKI